LRHRLGCYFALDVKSNNIELRLPKENSKIRYVAHEPERERERENKKNTQGADTSIKPAVGQRLQTVNCELRVISYD